MNLPHFNNIDFSAGVNLQIYIEKLLISYLLNNLYNFC